MTADDEFCGFCGESGTRYTPEGVTLCDSCFREDDDDYDDQGDAQEQEVLAARKGMR